MGPWDRQSTKQSEVVSRSALAPQSTPSMYAQRSEPALAAAYPSSLCAEVKAALAVLQNDFGSHVLGDNENPAASRTDHTRTQSCAMRSTSVDGGGN